jgi:DNA-binding NtrC family response regulator
MKVRQFNKILIVEDNLDLLENLQEIFSSYFSSVVAACDGASAFMAARDDDFDLILTDIKMEGFDGIELVTQLRAQGNLVPVVLMSAMANNDDLIKAIKLGVCDFVPKPYKIESLISTIYNVIEVRKREKSIYELLKSYGSDNTQVRQQKKMLGLLQAAQVTKKSA